MTNRKRGDVISQIGTYLRPCIFMLMCVVFYNANAQQKKISGIIYDDQGIPLPEVNVIVTGTKIGTLTDFDGVFNVQASKGDVLEISYLGMQTVFITIENNTNLSVTLETSSEVLDELVVIGYGTRKKSDVISSVTSVEPSEMLKVATSDVGEMLRGQSPGVQVTLGDGGPGSSSEILIRGIKSITGGNTPIVIADGVPIGSINDINPNDIASLEILKDAAAQAIYGARASNGVVLITTKRGAEGKVSISYNGSSGIQTINRNFDIYSGEEFAQLKREASRTANLGVLLPDDQIFSSLELSSIESGNFIDWEKEIIGTGVTNNHNLSLSAGTEKTSIYNSVNFFDQTGVVKNSDFTRVTARLNVDQKVNSWLKIGMNTSFQFSNGNRPNVGNIILSSITTSPLGEIYNEDGSLRLEPSGFEENKNPLVNLNETNTETISSNNILNLFLDITPFKNFKYRLNASRRSWDQKQLSYNSTNSVTGIASGGLANGSVSFNDEVEWQIENIFTYDTDFKTQDKHSLNLTAIQSISETQNNSFFNFANNIPNDILGINGLEAAESNIPSNTGFIRGLVSFAGRVQYDFDSKYHLTVSGRTDASTVFGTNNKWSFFPAVAAGWNVHKELFMDNITLVNNLKLRVSYGSVGNQGIDPYESLATAGLREYIIDGVKVTGYVPDNQLSNPDLKWETSTTLNAALDVGLWNNRITSTIEFYNTRTRDLLFNGSVDIPGFSSQLQNIGEVENQGIEIAVNGAVVRNEDFRLNLGVNFSRNRNKIISLLGEDADNDGIEDNDIDNNLFIGQPINVFNRFLPVGIFQEGEDIVSTHQPNALPGDVKLFDRDPNDGILNASDRVITSGVPDWFGTLNIGMEYLNFDFSANITTVQGIIRDNPFLYGFTEGGSLRGIKNGIQQNYWTPENPGGDFPRPNESDDPTNLIAQGLQDASYVRLQNITFGFKFPQKNLDALGLSKFRLYVTGSNLLTITDFQSYSPEKNPSDYPEAVSIVTGLQIGF